MKTTAGGIGNLGTATTSWNTNQIGGIGNVPFGTSPYTPYTNPVNNQNVTTDLFGLGTQGFAMGGISIGSSVKNIEATDFLKLISKMQELYAGGMFDYKLAATQVDALRELLNLRKLNLDDCPPLLGLFGVLGTNALANILKSDPTGFDNVIEALLSTFKQGTGYPKEATSKYAGIGTGFLGTADNKALRAFLSYCEENKINLIDSIGKFRRIYETFKQIKPEYNKIKTEAIWNLYKNLK